MRSNYLWGHENPWQLAGPPAWWLSLLYAADPELVVFPSKTEGVYRVARRVPQNTMPLMTALQSVPDTATYVTHGLMPITSLIPWTAWSPVVINDLMARNITRFGGFNAAADALDEFDARQEMQKRQQTTDRAHSIAHDDWWSTQFRTGSAISRAHQTRPERPTTARRQPAYRPLNLQGGGSAVFVGRDPERTKGPKIKPFVAEDTFVDSGRRSAILTP